MVPLSTLLTVSDSLFDEENPFGLCQEDGETHHYNTANHFPLTIQLRADELAEILARHARANMGLDLPESRAFMRLMSADGVAAKRVSVEVKW